MKDKKMNYPISLKEKSKEVEMVDITLPLLKFNFIEIRISSDAKTVWINTEEKCIMRLNRIGKLFLVDNRTTMKPEKIKLCPIHKNRQLYDNGYCVDCRGFPRENEGAIKK